MAPDSKQEENKNNATPPSGSRSSVTAKASQHEDECRDEGTNVTTVSSVQSASVSESSTNQTNLRIIDNAKRQVEDEEENEDENTCSMALLKKQEQQNESPVVDKKSAKKEANFAGRKQKKGDKTRQTKREGKLSMSLSSEAQKELLSSSQCSQNSASLVSSSLVFGGSQASSLAQAVSEQIAKEQERQTEETAHESNLLKCNAISRSMLALDNAVASNGHDKFQIVWQDLNFSYDTDFALCPSWLTKRRQKLANELVLRNVSGRINSNELVAIIGPSGCGKTTLLHFLAGNQASARDKVRIVGLNEPKVAFIGQHDNLLPGLTARETLVYASRLQNTRPNFDHNSHIQPILSELGLLECAERNVSKLSGGQAKRVAIAQELLYPTNLLALDEVTSGLDATTSYSIVKLLKYLVSDQSYPMSIVMSIHQPSARLFAVFDWVYVMSEGQCLYAGSCQVEQVNAYLGQFGLQCPRFHNIADYLIEIASSGSGGCEQDSMGAIKQQMVARQRKASENLVESARCAASHEATGNAIGALHLTDKCAQAKEQSVALLMIPSGQFGDSMAATQISCGGGGADVNLSLYEAIERARSKRQRPFCGHLLVHFHRSLLRIRRSAILTYLQLATYVLLGLQLATFYGSDIGQISGCPQLPESLISFVMRATSSLSGTMSDDADQQDVQRSNEMRRVQENMNFLLITVLLATFAALEITVITFPMEAKTIKREWRNGWYRVSSYFVGRTLADLPFSLSCLLIFCVLVYSLTDQIGLTTWRFACFLLVVVMTALVAQSVGFIFGAAFMDNLPAAVFTAPLAIFPSLLFSGFFSRVSQIPDFYKPMTYLSHFRYVFDALLVCLYGKRRCECDQAALDQYFGSLQNQSESMRDTFASMFGSNESCECASETVAAATTMVTSAPRAAQLEATNLIAHDDWAAIDAANSTLAALISSTVAAQVQALPSTGRPTTDGGGARRTLMGPLEDLLVDSLFRQAVNMGNSSQVAQNGSLEATLGARDESSMSAALMHSEQPAEPLGAIDRLSDKFSLNIARMLARQANFGRPVPRNCARFNSYLLQEFELDDSDLVISLLMLFVFVIVSRLLVGLILNFTIATRAR